MDGEEIAIVGVGCQFPGANNLSEFWRVLSNGENHVTEIQNDRWNVNEFYDEDPHVPRKTNVRRAGFVKGYDEWDHQFFGITEAEAEVIDPQQRMVLDCVHMALEDGGLTRKSLTGTNTGVYIGCMNDDYKVQLSRDGSANSAYMVSGIYNSIICARVSYVYNLLGPALTLDTGCSSSLVAIHIAGQALKLGECDMIICGGVNSLLDPIPFSYLTKAQMLSPTGQCRPFSVDADGYARGEGCGVVVMKRLKDAIRDGNKIWGTINSGTNQDGHMASPITAPSGLQQIDLLTTVYRKYKVEKETIQVIEAHGTGTPVGDPIEAKALGQFFSTRNNSTETILIGSVKSNIGHTEAAAGVAGLIKVLLMMKHGIVVPTLMYSKQKENPKINFEQYGLSVPTTCIQWKKPRGHGRAGCVNSFGFGGSNAHAVIMEYESKEADTMCEELLLPPIITISATNEDSLKENIETFSRQLSEHVYDMKSLSFTSTCQRDHWLYRKAFLADSQNKLIENCVSGVSNLKPQTLSDKTNVVFVFCGVGTTWNGMCRHLMNFEVFRNTIRSIDTFLYLLAGFRIETKIQRSEVVNDALTEHISIFACQLGLIALWNYFGVRPDVVVGQSVGEVAAAYSSGAIDLESAVKIIYFRSKFLAEIENGSMAVVKNYPVEKVDVFCRDPNHDLTIAVSYSQQSCTVSGDTADIHKLKTEIDLDNNDTNGIVIDLHAKCAYHSHHVDAAASGLETKLHNLKRGKQLVPVISTVTGKQESHDIFSQGMYWVKNTRHKVRFGDAIKATTTSFDGKSLFVEIGPSPVLGAHIHLILHDKSKWCTVPSMRKRNEARTLAQTLCTAFEYGLDLEWKNIVPQSKHITEVPQYVFRNHNTLHKGRTVAQKNPDIMMDDTTESHMYLQQNPNKTDTICYTATVDESTTPFVFQHIVKDSVIVPCAFYADIGYAIGQAVLGRKDGYFEVSLELKEPAVVYKNETNILVADAFPYSQIDTRFHVKLKNEVICIGKVLQTVDKTKNQSMDIEMLRYGLKMKSHLCLRSDQMYSTLNQMGFKHGKCFQVMKNCITNGRQSITEIELPDDVVCDLDRTFIHPCVLDGMLQTASTVTNEQAMSVIENEKLILMPVALETIMVYKKPQKDLIVYTTRTNLTILDTVIKLHYNIVLLNPDGTVVAEIINYTTYSRRHTSSTPDELKYELSWRQILGSQDNYSSANVILLSLTYDPSVLNGLDGDQILVCHLKSNQIKNISVYFSEVVVKLAEQKWGSFNEVNAIAVLLVGDETVQQNICPNAVNSIFRELQQNCMLLVHFLKCMVEKEMKVPLFIATQNTQRLKLDDAMEHPVSLVGNEIWGFIRNVQTEFVHDEMALVDLQPSFREAKLTFMNFVMTHCRSMLSSRTEYAIYLDKVFYSEFVKTDMSERTPLFLKRIRASEIKQGDILSEKSDCVSSPYILPLKPTMTTHQLNDDKYNIQLQVSTICLHSSFIYPTTTSCATGMVDRWHSGKDQGHSIIGLEYSGYPTKNEVKGKVKYTTDNSPNSSDGMRKTIAVYPKPVSTTMDVPRECCVSMNELPFYQPNLLTTSILLTKMMEFVPCNSEVRYVCNKNDHMADIILQKMLTTKQCSGQNAANSNSESDVVLIARQISEEELDILQEAKCVIFLAKSIPEKLHELLLLNDGVECIEINTKRIFRRNVIAKYLKSVTKWLQDHFQQCMYHTHMLTHDETCKCYPPSEQTIEVMSKDRVSCLPYKTPLVHAFQKCGTYIITGGLTGLGWQFLLLFAEMGAGTIVTMSRRALNEETSDTVEAVKREHQCNIICLQVDVTNLQMVQTAVKELQRMPNVGPIRGIVHGSGVLDVKVLIDMKEENITFVLGPKVLGAMNLHIATEHIELDFYILQSSISSYNGIPGQANYGAANSFLDAFSYWRRQLGLPAQSINWGALKVGMAANKNFAENLLKRGYRLLPIPEIRSCFLQALMQDSTESVYAEFDWPMFMRNYTLQQMERIGKQFENIFKQKQIEIKTEPEDESNMYSDEFIKRLRNADKHTQKKELEKFALYVTRRVSVANFPVNLTSTFSALGMDSMSLIMFTNVVYDVTHFRINQQFMVDPSLCVSDVVSHLQPNLFGS